MNKPEWMDDPSLTGIDKVKLEFLQTLVFESQSLAPKELFAYLMNITKRNPSSISFSPEEMNLIIAVLKRHSSPEEIARIDKVLKMRAQKK